MGQSRKAMCSGTSKLLEESSQGFKSVCIQEPYVRVPLGFTILVLISCGEDKDTLSSLMKPNKRTASWAPCAAVPVVINKLLRTFVQVWNVETSWNLHIMQRQTFPHTCLIHKLGKTCQVYFKKTYLSLTSPWQVQLTKTIYICLAKKNMSHPSRLSYGILQGKSSYLNVFIHFSVFQPSFLFSPAGIVLHLHNRTITLG